LMPTLSSSATVQKIKSYSSLVVIGFIFGYKDTKKCENYP